MTKYIATFYSHFGAVRFAGELKKQNTASQLMPVPRALSSSCGTCVSFEADRIPELSHPDEIEQIVSAGADGSFNICFSTLED